MASATVLDEIIAVLDSNEFRCPAYRWEEPHYTPIQVREPVVHDDWTEVFESYVAGPPRGTYDEHDRCTETVYVEEETESDYDGWPHHTYLAVYGECAEWHGYEWQEGYVVDTVIALYRERQRLLRTVRDVIGATKQVAA